MHRVLSRFTPLLADTKRRFLARIKSNCQKKGGPIAFIDAWIAAVYCLLRTMCATTPLCSCAALSRPDSRDLIRARTLGCSAFGGRGRTRTCDLLRVEQARAPNTMI